MRKLILFALALVLTGVLVSFKCVARAATETELRVAVAADLAPAIPEIAAAYAKLHPEVQILTSIGSSVQLRQQIESGAPFDVFLSADREQPQALVEAGKAIGPPTLYALGQLVIVSKAHIKDVHALTSAGVKKIAIANPAHAPYGRAAMAALKSARIWDAVQAKIVYGENVAQTAQFILSGNVDAALVSATAASSAKQFHVHAVDEDLYPKILQAGVVVSDTAHIEQAREFLEFMESATVRRLLTAHGLQIPNSKNANSTHR